ncbi:hypothetical protein AVEN_254529-1 [Araneus ventricosus]|uniref:Uncharacterized protein n=1 Tax=Araneus ventricosus TaxID=182803 RepID=A0A4Y2R763_ARAVE|nr:hypothetical protein AVEN_254529-1 [Araneus ventricosus]
MEIFCFLSGEETETFTSEWTSPHFYLTSLHEICGLVRTTKVPAMTPSTLLPGWDRVEGSFCSRPWPDSHAGHDLAADGEIEKIICVSTRKSDGTKIGFSLRSSLKPYYHNAPNCEMDKESSF